MTGRAAKAGVVPRHEVLRAGFERRAVTLKGPNMANAVPIPERWFWAASGVGLLVWCGRAAVSGVRPLQVEWAVTLLLFSPLVLAPLVLPVVGRLATTTRERRLLRCAAGLQLPAALLLVWGVAGPASIESCLACLPWLGTTLLMAAVGACRVQQRGMTPVTELCTSAGLLYVSIGGVWLCLWRLGVRPLGFENVIVLLTAIHFHYAGFILPLLAGEGGRATGGRPATLTAWGVIVGVPAVAAGISATQLGLSPGLEIAAATGLAAAGIATAVVQWASARSAATPAPARWCLSVSSLALVGTMLLAALYGWRSVHHWDWLDIPWMRAWHGTGNALCACGLGVLGRVLCQRSP